MQLQPPAPPPLEYTKHRAPSPPEAPSGPPTDYVALFKALAGRDLSQLQNKDALGALARQILSQLAEQDEQLPRTTADLIPPDVPPPPFPVQRDQLGATLSDTESEPLVSALVEDVLGRLVQSGQSEEASAAGHSVPSGWRKATAGEIAQVHLSPTHIVALTNLY